jgi:hypothetical protein
MATDLKLFPQFLNEFEQTVESAAARLLSLSQEQIQESYGEDKWTRKQILGHLIDSAANNHQRFVRAQFTDALVFPGYEQERWVDVQHYNDEDWSQLVQLWKLYNLHLAHLASFISPEALRGERTEHNLDQIAWQSVDRKEPVTLEYFIRDYAGHMNHHLAQIVDST